MVMDSSKHVGNTIAGLLVEPTRSIESNSKGYFDLDECRRLECLSNAVGKGVACAVEKVQDADCLLSKEKFCEEDEDDEEKRKTTQTTNGVDSFSGETVLKLKSFQLNEGGARESSLRNSTESISSTIPGSDSDDATISRLEQQQRSTLTVGSLEHFPQSSNSVVPVKKVEWKEGFRSPLGADGRQVLLRKLRAIYHANSEYWDQRLAKEDILFSRMPYATVQDLYKVSHLLGVFDFAVKCSAEYGGDPASSRGPKKRRKSNNSSAITMTELKNELENKTGTVVVPFEEQHSSHRHNSPNHQNQNRKSDHAKNIGCSGTAVTTTTGRAGGARKKNATSLLAKQENAACYGLDHSDKESNCQYSEGGVHRLYTNLDKIVCPESYSSFSFQNKNIKSGLKSSGNESNMNSNSNSLFVGDHTATIGGQNNTSLLFLPQETITANNMNNSSNIHNLNEQYYYSSSVVNQYSSPHYYSPHCDLGTSQERSSPFARNRTIRKKRGRPPTVFKDDPSLMNIAFTSCTPPLNSEKGINDNLSNNMSSLPHHEDIDNTSLYLTQNESSSHRVRDYQHFTRKLLSENLSTANICKTLESYASCTSPLNTGNEPLDRLTYQYSITAQYLQILQLLSLQQSLLKEQRQLEDKCATSYKLNLNDLKIEIKKNTENNGNSDEDDTVDGTPGAEKAQQAKITNSCSALTSFLSQTIPLKYSRVNGP